MPTWSRNTPGAYFFTVPAGISNIDIDARGGGGAAYTLHTPTGPQVTPGGSGGRVTGKMQVTPGQVLWVFVGAGGTNILGTTIGGGGSGGASGSSLPNGGAGGGVSAIRLTNNVGPLRVVAAGGGGATNGRRGGHGGGATGENGVGGSGTSAATGGTQTQAGNGGSNACGAGGSPPDNILIAGGAGDAPFGGGGGGGYHPGGGGAGQCSSAPAGSGAGGANFVTGLISPTSSRGGGSPSKANGVVTITWASPSPNVPTDVLINGLPEEEDLATRSTGTVSVSAILSDPDVGDTVRLLVRYSTTSNFSSFTDVYSGFVGSGARASVNLTGLAQNTKFYLRLYAQDNRGNFSQTYNATSFWTNRKATPALVFPPENQTLSSTSSTIFKWDFLDPDPDDTQSAFRLAHRTISATGEAGAWTQIERVPYTVGCGLPDPANRFCWMFDPGTFQGNTFYEWRVQVRDAGGLWSDWTPTQGFYVQSTSTAPRLISPSRDEAIEVENPVLFRWEFLDPDPGDSQKRADLRYRVVGQTEWVTVLGADDPGIPGSTESWEFQGQSFAPGYHYEWQMRTYDTISSAQSGWSESAFFYSIGRPGGAVLDTPPVAVEEVQGSLGCGTYRVFVYAQGGEQMIGEIDPIAHMQFSRVRDDISNALITTNGFGPDCCQLLSELRSWMHEIVIFRDGVRVWEGPVTRITYTVGHVEIEAKDCMAYVYRRIMRQGYNDSSRVVFGEQLGLTTVVRRAQRIILNALAPWDPNLIPYLTAIENPNDARQSRVVHDYAKTAWEEVDDLAATAGLDYTVIGRRIMLWDTHEAIGRLPEMRDGDFSDPPVVTEYGMQLSNYFAVTNGSGVWGSAERNFPAFFGPIELLASAYGEASGGTEDVLTPAAKAALTEALTEQAERNIADRWPTPLIVRVPDNSTLNPNIGVGFDQLVPGVHIPLRATGTCRNVAQWQKLDSVTVEYDSRGERVKVVMSPAPDDGVDLDATQGEEG